MEDGRVRELYKSTGGAWCKRVNEAFVKYFSDILSDRVIDFLKEDYISELVDMMHDFEQIKRKISLNDQNERVVLTLRPFFVPHK